ncbi:MAG: homoaconitate hydratase [Candidatus Aenigmarchaeota archaeon]|nr:homoaconitate hydratase [Candidatus Aenigmarchaeota archaeon]
MVRFCDIKIHDTTLRDGEQMPGVVFSPKQKIELATLLSDFGVSYIELMPAVFSEEMMVAKTLVGMGLASKLTASTMLNKDSVDLALECGLECITLFTPLSDIQLDTVGIGRSENLRKSLELVDYALSHGLRVGFAGVDVTRADMEYVLSFMNALPRRMEYFMVCDTLGCMTPMKAYAFFNEICSKTHLPVCLHEHNDFGLATANTLMGISAGAEMFSGTFTGIGERAGNAPIEEVVSSLKFLYDVDLPVKYERMTEICNMVEKHSEVRLQDHKPIVGRNAFRHESGIHVDALLKDADSYEIFNPVLVGQKRTLAVGKHSGGCIVDFLAGKKYKAKDRYEILKEIKSESQRIGRSLTRAEAMKILRFTESQHKKMGDLYA